MKKTIILLLLIIFLLTGCSKGTEEIALYKRRILRVDLVNQKTDLYDADTTISQLLSLEERSRIYNFNSKTIIAYDTRFLTIPATLVYSFDDNSDLTRIEYYFDFSSENAEKEIDDVYEECIKFFGYPDEGYTKGIYQNLHKSPSVLWVKNNAQISLEYTIDDDLNAHAKMAYYHSEWSGTSVSVFKLPFSPHALGDSILTVVGAESKENSETIKSVVSYSYIPLGEERMGVSYIFTGENLTTIELVLNANVKNEKQMTNLVNNLKKFMEEEFDESFSINQSNEDAVDINWKSKDMDIDLYFKKDSGNRKVISTINFY